MFALVNDIEAYPRFLPWCKGARIEKSRGDEICASIELAVGAVHKSFSTCNRVQKNKMIEVRLIEGPFRHLEGFWRFEPLGGRACKVVLDMEFEFSTRLLDMALGPIFHQIVTTLVDAFCKRAEEVYGKR
ncbi:MAG: type II toxin-antitoxin system RatA family toxin [Gammaproteobacteria bacterium]|nr:MAG: type II toxin-antitoxin system RatA family toxin [Gammaproteobacteria bacterium]